VLSPSSSAEGSSEAGAVVSDVVVAAGSEEGVLEGVIVVVLVAVAVAVWVWVAVRVWVAVCVAV